MMDAPIMADVQSSPDHRQIAIDRVGIKGLRHPIRVRDRSGREQSTVATFGMFVALPHHFKGTHMSRFVAILNEQDFALAVDSMPGLLAEVKQRLDAEAARVEVRFTFFVEKTAPISGVRSLLDYEVTLIGDADADGVRQTTQITIPVTTLCPCSKQIAEYGAHNQRSHICVTLESTGPLWLEDIIERVEAQASSEIYGLLKRADEKYVTERAYDNPKFVEDLARDLAAAFQSDPRVRRYVIEVENFESIHNHSAYAMIESSAR